MDRVECPTPAYNQLVKTGLAKQILEQKKLVHNLLSGFYLPADKPNSEENLEDRERAHIKKTYPIYEKAHQVWNNPSRGISDESEIARDVLDFLQDLREQEILSHQVKYLHLDHPSFLTQVILGNRATQYRKYGFHSRKDLELAIVSYCVGEDIGSSYANEWVWRQGDWKNTINQNMHGDLYVAQVDVSGQDTIQKTLFGDERRFDCIKPSPECRGIGAYQDWSQFLLATLKYAEKIGQAKHPDIVNWKEVLESIGGGVGTNTAECMFGNRNNDHTAEMLFMPELWNDKDTPKTVPLTVFNHGVKDAHFIPYVQEDKLIYLIENSKGEFTFNNRFFEDKKFRKCLEYTPEDIPQVLRGTYKYFARDRSMLSLILERFNQESH